MILQKVERYLDASGMAASAFGLRVAGDPRLVFELRRGRQPGARMIARIEAQIGFGL